MISAISDGSDSMAADPIRPSEQRDRRSLELLYAEAFPDEDLMPLVGELLDLTDETVSLVAVADFDVVGHVIFTRCKVEGDATEQACALLGPLAVLPARQRSGFGSRLVRHGLERLIADGISRVLVLGSPVYYARFGFTQEAAISTPCPIPDVWRTAWQSIALRQAGDLRGALSLPAPWMQPSLWSP